MSPRFVLGREDVPCVAEVVNRSLKADCTDFTLRLLITETISKALAKLAKAAITRCDLSATILFKLVDSYLIAFKFVQ